MFNGPQLDLTLELIKTKMKFTFTKFLIYWVPMLVWMAGNFFTSSLTPMETGVLTSRLPSLINEVSIHTGEFAVLSVLTFRVLRAYGSMQTSMLWIVTLMVSIIYGVTDELHQSFVPGRVPSWIDLGYDMLGALVGLITVELAIRSTSHFYDRAN